MKWIFHLTVIIAFFNACSNSQHKNINPSLDTNTNKTIQNIEPIDSNSSFAGKHSTVIDSLGWFRCWGALALSTSGDATYFGIEQVSSSKSECNTGKVKILLEKLIYRTEYGKPVYLILDELNVRSDLYGNSYSSATCKLKGTDHNETLLVHYKSAKETERSEIIEMWRIDPKKNSFVKVTSSGMFECIEEEVCIEEDVI